MDNNSTKGMKIILPGLCPHCSHEVMLTIAMTMPHLLSIHKPEDFDKAKEKALSVVETINFQSPQHKQMAIDFVKEMSFGPAEVDDVIAQIIPQAKEPTDK